MMRLQPGHFVRVFNKFYKIGNFEPLRYETGKEASAFFSAIASGSQSGYKNITELEPDDVPRHLFWVVPGIENGMDYSIKIPTGTSRWGSDVTKGIGFVTNRDSPFYAPNEELGFYLVKDYFPSIQGDNVTGVTMTPKVYFTGFKYDLLDIEAPDILNRLKSGQLPFYHITIGGINVG